jgi:hypothetical protein
MPEILQKLRPDRDLQCYFLRPSAIAAFSSTGANGFTLSGSWRQQFDWAVIEWNRDNTFEHPALRNLPDGDLSGITLTYEETRQNCIPIDSSLFATIDWPSLRIWTDQIGASNPYFVPLKSHATAIAGSYAPATATFTLQGTITAGDSIELAWSTEHYTYQVTGSDTLETAAEAVTSAIHVLSPTMDATRSGTQITLTYLGQSPGGPRQSVANSTTGTNGNRIGVYGNISGAKTESWQPWFQQLSGGTSPTKWRITLDFSSLQDANGVTIPMNAVRKMRWTYSADLQPGTFLRSEFQVTVSNWTVSGTNLTYKVADASTRRIEDTAPDVSYGGTWNNSRGNFSGGTIHDTTVPGATVSCTYRASQAHTLYLGTRRGFNGTQITVVIDNGPASTRDLFIGGEDVLVRMALADLPGQTPHTITITHAGAAGSHFYFDFLELAVPSGSLPVLPTDARTTLATDWDTDHSIALAPERTAWMIKSLGFTGRANHYVGALWHYELTAQDYTYASATVQFLGTPSANQITTVSIGLEGSPAPPTDIQHLNLVGDTATSIAKAFELEINSGYTAIWAQATGTVLTIHARAIGLAGTLITISASPSTAVPPETFVAQTSGQNFTGGADGNWRTDLTAMPRMNRAARDWSRGFFVALGSYGIAVTAAFSMELQHGDPSPGAGIAQRYPSQNAVLLNTPAIQTNFSPASTAFWRQAYLDLAQLLSDAGQTPYLQFGEVQWWYSPDDGSGMPYYDAYTTSTFAATYGRPMQVFTNSSVSPALYPDEAHFLPGLIGTFTTAIINFVRQTFPSTKFEVLYPPDVNNTPLNGAVNLPATWNASTLDCMKTENFTYTGGRNLDLAKTAIVLPMQLGFPRSKSSHLVGITGYTTPWQKEARLAQTEAIESIVLFALDQFCLMNCPAPMPVGARRSGRMG